MVADEPHADNQRRPHQDPRHHRGDGVEVLEEPRLDEHCNYMHCHNQLGEQAAVNGRQRGQAIRGMEDHHVAHHEYGAHAGCHRVLGVDVHVWSALERGLADYNVERGGQDDDKHPQRARNRSGCDDASEAIEQQPRENNTDGVEALETEVDPELVAPEHRHPQDPSFPHYAAGCPVVLRRPVEHDGHAGHRGDQPGRDHGPGLAPAGQLGSFATVDLVEKPARCKEACGQHRRDHPAQRLGGHLDCQVHLPRRVVGGLLQNGR
mmetsp:Transcript_28367/g.74160  ORF Transcript_28367/g.74160 Transcript_28367/m.74160 type:complete len:264 (-) Transcript_28367:460-1251(-)